MRFFKAAFVSILFSVIFLHNATACLNYYYTVDQKGEVHDQEDMPAGFNLNFNVKKLRKNMERSVQEIEKTGDYQLLSDYAVMLLKAGKVQEGRDILYQLSLVHPEEYRIITNLGTAYELNGEVEAALATIKRGMELNPNSHEGSEWVHVKVLETKLALMTDHEYLASHTVLQITSDDKAKPETRKHINIQVRERFPFTMAPDPIMASIMLDLADCTAMTESFEIAKAMYQIASLRFGANDSVVKVKTNEMLKWRNEHKDVFKERGDKYFEGDYVRINGMPYKRFMDDNNKGNYSIDWSEVKFDPKELLSFVGLTMQEEVATSVEEPEVESEQAEEAPKAQSPEQDNSIYFYWFIVLVLFIGYRVITVKQNRKREQGGSDS